jgi:hypothetical protein
MKRFLMSVMTFLFIASLGSGIASAKSCRDAKGKFTKCPTTMAAPKPKQCRDAKGKFTKCKTTMSTMSGMKH